MKHQKYYFLNFDLSFYFRFKFNQKDFISNFDGILNLIFFTLSKANLINFNFFVEFMIPIKLSEIFLI